MSEYKKPLPVIEPWSQAFWDGTKEKRLLIQQCNDCGSKIFNPRKFCPECWAGDLGWSEASGKGTIYSFSITYSGVEDMFKDDLPLVLAWVDLEEGIRMLTNIIDCDPDDVEIGMNVKVAFKEVTPEITMPFFKLA